MFPGDGPVFVGACRFDDQMAVRGEMKYTRKVLADEEVAGVRALHVMGDGMCRFIDVIAAERGLVAVVNILIRWGSPMR
jgi:hypothetical protein